MGADTDLGILQQLKRQQQQIDLLLSRDVQGSRGWYRSPYTWTRVSNTTFDLLSIDMRVLFCAGAKVWWQEATVSKYAYVVSSALSGSDTRVTIVGDAMMVSPDSRSAMISYADCPQGFPAQRGTAFPASFPEDMPFFRTDLNMWCSYDGARWLSSQQFSSHLTQQVITATGFNNIGRIRTDYAPFIDRLCISSQVTVTNDATNNWDFHTSSCSATFTGITTIDSGFNTGADGVAIYKAREQAPDTTQTPANYGMMRAYYTKNNAPGNLVYSVSYYYRLIIP